MGLKVFFNPLSGNLDMSPSLENNSLEFNNWQADQVKPAPLEVIEYGQRVMLFNNSNDGQAMNARFKVFADYYSGQLLLRVGLYCPAILGKAAFKATAILRRQGQDFSSNALTYVWNSGDIDFSVAPLANKSRKIEIAFTDITGKIGGVKVAPDDIIDFTLERVAPTSDETNEQIRVISIGEIIKT